MSHGPIQADLHQVMDRMGAVIDDALNPSGPRNWGFVLLMFDFNNPADARMNYLSNADRTDMICAMKELVANFEGRAPESTGHA